MLDVWTSVCPPAVAECLDAAEQARRERFLCPEAREAYAIAHSLARRVLSRYDPSCAPHRWRFAHGPAGKPSVASPFAYRFNLSHSGRATAIAVADEEVGVDIERHRALPAGPAIAERVFHPRERRWLAAQPSFETAFLRLWTLKEALLKAAGTGFSRPPQEACWDELDAPWLHATFAGERWTGTWRCLGEATVAVAVRAGAAVAGARLLRLDGAAPPRWIEQPLEH
ncbi:MAG TPA: 4'-phosphopantetheinyl transferase superfamily protein [Albitalea sp.]